MAVVGHQPRHEGQNQRGVGELDDRIGPREAQLGQAPERPPRCGRGVQPEMPGALPWSAQRSAARRATTLFAGRAVHRRTRVARGTPPRAHSAASGTANGWRRPTDEQAQGLFIGTLLRSFGQGLRMNRSKYGTPARLHHGDHDLRSAGGGKYDAVELWAAAGDLDEFSHAGLLHGHRLLRARRRALECLVRNARVLGCDRRLPARAAA
jgi:hypothetical protein